jgi:hypothetical protein
MLLSCVGAAIAPVWLFSAGDIPVLFGDLIGHSWPEQTSLRSIVSLLKCFLNVTTADVNEPMHPV